MLFYYIVADIFKRITNKELLTYINQAYTNIFLFCEDAAAGCHLMPNG